VLLLVCERTKRKLSKKIVYINRVTSMQNEKKKKYTNGFQWKLSTRANLKKPATKVG
jgi:hypothetical protein